MPELPEVENLSRDLRAALVGREIVGVRCRQPKMLNLPVEEFAARVRGRVVDVQRRGKSSVVRLERGSIWLHLGLGGLVALAEGPAEEAQLAISFADGTELTISKTFMGHAHYYDEAASAARWAELGPEPTDASFTVDELRQILARKPKQGIKALLMDQNRIAGIGNVYSDEILHAARIHPGRAAGSLSEEETAQLYAAIGRVLAEAFRSGGEPDYTRLDGSHGAYEMRVHAVPACLDCGTPVTQASLAGRTAYYCGKCQG